MPGLDWLGRQSRGESKSLLYYDLRWAFRASGCPVCHLCDEEIRRFYHWFLYQNYYAPSMMAKLQSSAGFCREHAWRLLEYGVVYQIAVVARYLVEDQQQKLGVLQAQFGQLSAQRRTWKRRASLPRMARPGESCPACQTLANHARSATQTLAHWLADEGFAAEYRASDRLCLDHLAIALESASPETAARLVELTLEKLTALATELEEYFRKVDYRFADEPKGDEQTAWRRAIETFVGWRYDSG
ncbi:MAG: DUF6062 family protein [Ardenticatenaceae bacterium]|nr:DUF6062 family protein [Ardenticatenaceae bacterium]